MMTVTESDTMHSPPSVLKVSRVRTLPQVGAPGHTHAAFLAVCFVGALLYGRKICSRAGFECPLRSGPRCAQCFPLFRTLLSRAACAPHRCLSRGVNTHLVRGTRPVAVAHVLVQARLFLRPLRHADSNWFSEPIVGRVLAVEARGAAI